MTKDPITITKDKTTQVAAALMKQHNIGAILVTDNTQIEGIITEKDLLTHIVAESKLSSEVLVQDAMTKKVITINQNEPYYKALNVMSEFKLKKLIVIDEEKPVGILTQTDVLKFFSRNTEE